MNPSGLVMASVQVLPGEYAFTPDIAVLVEWGSRGAGGLLRAWFTVTGGSGSQATFQGVSQGGGAGALAVAAEYVRLSALQQSASPGEIVVLGRLESCEGYGLPRTEYSVRRGASLAAAGIDATRIVPPWARDVTAFRAPSTGAFRFEFLTFVGTVLAEATVNGTPGVDQMVPLRIPAGVFGVRVVNTSLGAFADVQYVFGISV